MEKRVAVAATGSAALFAATTVVALSVTGAFGGEPARSAPSGTVAASTTSTTPVLAPASTAPAGGPTP